MSRPPALSRPLLARGCSVHRTKFASETWRRGVPSTVTGILPHDSADGHRSRSASVAVVAYSYFVLPSPTSRRRGDCHRKNICLSKEQSAISLFPRTLMPHKTRPMTALLLFTGVNVILLQTITPVYDFVCFHPYWERRREQRRKEREAEMTNDSKLT